MGAYRGAVLVTGACGAEDQAKADWVGGLTATSLQHPPQQESGSLVRLVGPMCAALLGLRFCLELMTRRGLSLPEWGSSLALVPKSYRELSTGQRSLSALTLQPAWGWAFDSQMATSLMWKWQEALYTPLPTSVDVLAFAHGPLQSLYDRDAVLLALRRSGDAESDDLWKRLRRSLHPSRHRVLELLSELPGPLSFFEYDARLNAILLKEMSRRGIDPGTWPGQSTDEPLYSVTGPSRKP